MAWRKSWVYENIHGHNGDGVCSKRRLLPDERSVWDDYLDLATPPNTPIAGQVCISKEIGYTPGQLGVILKTPVDIIERANKHMIELEMITIGNNGIVIINNWRNYQSDYERQKHYREKLQQVVTPKGYSKRRNVTNISISISTIKDIFNYWNNKKIYIHKSLDNHSYNIDKAIRVQGYTVEEIKVSIDTYAMVLKGEKYFWTYKWTLSEFLNRGLEKFMDKEIVKKNFLKKDYIEVSDSERKLKKQAREAK